ncbi:hypothetical protein CONLIGDRAFT_683859 [Coniochaeta ligniaria NRRL 30616]|uniref:C2H2-type domain-containing protein n=1 Tax=Coniochaeta ligniaria NRRL 30616 TaxID=1408157 RepID=A0A1J7IGR8_9PEZI|nr:hypothetical protein CONLIGDRAFT_683859 [Coniochaeta ligniaria NRRL 30616]
MDEIQAQRPIRKPSAIGIDHDDGARVLKRKRQPSIVVISDDDSPARISRPRSSPGAKSQLLQPTRKTSIISIDDESPAPKRHRHLFLKKCKPRIPKNPSPRPGATPEEIIRCEHCEEEFETIGSGQEHLFQAHPDEFSKLNARCWDCSFRFPSIQELDEHVKSMHTDKSLSDHDDDNNPKKKTHPKVHCFVCSSPISKPGMRQHVKNKHPLAWDPAFKLDKMEKRYCPVCERLIDAEHRNLKDHIHKIHCELWKRGLTEREMLGSRKKEEEEEPRWADCRVCQKRYTADRLERHMELMHGSEAPV